MNKQLSDRGFILLLAFLTVAVHSAAQQKTVLRAAVDKNRILIGEPMRLTLEADIPENEAIRFFAIDTIPHFEILQKQKTDTSDTEDGTLMRQVITLTSFDSGQWVIPAFHLGENAATDSIPVDVVFSEFDPGQDYHDIKDIIEVSPEKQKDRRWLWLLIGGGALVVALILFILLRKKKSAPAPPPPVINPYEEAMRLLEQLGMEPADKKQYYSALADIFRVYLDKSKGINSLKKTTDDIVVQLRGLAIEKRSFEKLSQSLRLIDFVKFAKYVPSRADDRETYETVRNAIMEIEQLK